MPMIFVDTGAWFASVVPWDKNHVKAVEWLASNEETLFTTDFILDETLTLLRARKEEACALALGEQLLSDRLGRLYFLDANDIRAAWDVFRAFDDKDWSFTDCTSKVVMEKLKITTAFSLDQHFRQFGNVQVVPA
jgi:predicted nucleic acid-binding protein